MLKNKCLLYKRNGQNFLNEELSLKHTLLNILLDQHPPLGCDIHNISVVIPYGLLLLGNFELTFL